MVAIPALIGGALAANDSARNFKCGSDKVQIVGKEGAAAAAPVSGHMSLRGS